MSSAFKGLGPEQPVHRETVLHEATPITGSIISGTYHEAYVATNIKNFAHGQFQSVYDYPYLSSSANHIFDITCGYANSSDLSSSSNTQNAKKINIYNQLAQVLVGHDHTNSIGEFPEDGGAPGSSGTKLKEVYFITLSRLLTKDEIKKGTFKIEIGVEQEFTQIGASDHTIFDKRVIITDASGTAKYFVNSPSGEYGMLHITGSSTNLGNVLYVDSTNESKPCGLIYYQAGVVVLSGSIFGARAGAVGNQGLLRSNNYCELASDISASGFNAITGSTIETMADGLRNRIYNIQFNNTTQLQSSIYFCRINHNEFNYSSNPTYLTESKIRVKETQNDLSKTFITTVGLYNAQNQLMAVAKTSEPLVKTPADELTIRVRLDY